MPRQRALRRTPFVVVRAAVNSTAARPGLKKQSTPSACKPHSEDQGAHGGQRSQASFYYLTKTVPDTCAFFEGLNNKIRVIQRRAYGFRDEEYLRLKILTCMLPKL